jgi:hypothetical protein
VCERSAVDLDKTGSCKSFNRTPGFLVGVGHDKRLRGALEEAEERAKQALAM